MLLIFVCVCVCVANNKTILQLDATIVFVGHVFFFFDLPLLERGRVAFPKFSRPHFHLSLLIPPPNLWTEKRQP